MAKVVVSFLLLGSFLGSLHGGAGAEPTTARPSNQLDQMNSEIEEMKSVISLLVRRSYDKDNRGDCYWKKVNHNVIPTGYLVPNAQTLQLCQEICERTTGCVYVEWTPCDRLCHLSKQPNAQRYERSCSATMSTQLSTIPPAPAGKPIENMKESSTTETVTPSSRSPLTTSETDDAIAMSTPDTDTSEMSTPDTDTSEMSTPETDRPTSERVETSTLLPSTTSTPLSTIPTVPAETSDLPSTTSTPLSTIPTVPATTSSSLSTIPTVPATTSSPLSTIPTVPAETSDLPSTTSTPLSTIPTMPVCKRRLDLAFIIDGSGSICDVISARNYNGSCENWNFNIQFIHKLIDRLTIGPDDTRVALVKFATSVQIEWMLNNHTDKSSLLSAVDNLTYPTGMTNTSGALMTIVNDVFVPAAGDRPNVPNRAILVTDGDPNIETVPLPAAIKAVHNSGIKIFVVGVTEYVKEKTLRDVSSPPQQINESYFVVKDYCSIDLVLEQLLKESCIL